jgi:ABC-type branched-subunit amino acid transport system substrate-binding protein
LKFSQTTKRFFAGAALSLIGALLSLSAHAAILIGQTAGMTGPTAGAMKEINDGAKLYFDSVNKKGGINGQQIEIVTLDDKFDAANVIENAKILINEKNVLALFLSRGTAQTEALLPLLAQYDIALVAPSTGAMSLHEPVNKYVYNVRAPYQKEASKAVALMTTTDVKEIAVIYRNDGFGKDGLAGAMRGFSAAGIKPAFVIAVDKTKPDFKESIEQAKAKRPQAIMIIEAPGTAARAVNELRAAGVMSQVTVLSNCASKGFVKDLGANARGVIVSQVFPGERSYGIPVISELSELAKEKKIDVSPATIEGYTAAKVLVRAIATTSGPLNRKSLRLALDSMQKFDMGGLTIAFGPNDHSGLDFTDLSIIGFDGKFKR